MPLTRLGPDRAQRAPRRPVPKLALCCAALLLGGPVQAQSLNEVFEAARGFDPTYLGARALADSARYRLEQIRALRRPSVDLSLSAARSRVDSPATPSNGGSLADTNGLQAELAATQSLFNRPNDLLIAQGERNLDAARAALALSEQDLIVRVAQAYFDVLAATDALQSVQGDERAISEQQASARRNFEVGNATITDTREAEARLDLARAQEIGAQNDLAVKRAALDQLIGRIGVAPHPLAPPAALPPVQPAQAEDWVRLAQADSPSLKQAALGYEIAKLESERARAGHLPTVALGAFYDRSRNGTDYALRNPPANTPTSGSYVGMGGTAQVAVTLNVPLFAGYAIENRVKEAVLLEEKSRNDFEAARNAVSLGTRTAFLGAQSGFAQVQALQAAEGSSRLALEATQLGYKVGVKVNLDVLNAQSQLFQTQRDLSKARYDYLVGTLRLRQAAGELKADDVRAMDALLVP